MNDGPYRCYKRKGFFTLITEISPSHKTDAVHMLLDKTLKYSLCVQLHSARVDLNPR